jgi:predicted nucleic-acid-binding Zn-ribbon protein
MEAPAPLVTGRGNGFIRFAAPSNQTARVRVHPRIVALNFEGHPSMTTKTLTCLRCGYSELPVTQYECPKCGKPNLKAVSATSMLGGGWIIMVFGAFFAVIAALTIWSRVELLMK